ncbi:MAG: hypothetical protein IKG80_05940 [Clostridia bacterium]|nr:hypothetical protein [Clostridia bacterium]
MLPKSILDNAVKSTAPKGVSRCNSVFSVICHPKGGKRVRIAKALMDGPLKGVTSVSFSYHDNYIFVLADENGYPLQQKDGKGAATLYRGEIVAEMTDMYKWDFSSDYSRHFAEYEMIEDTVGVAIKVA